MENKKQPEQEKSKVRKSRIGANIPWYQAMDHPGAYQMGYVRRLFESRPYTKLVPDNNILVDAPLLGGAKVRAATAADGSFSFVYSPRGKQFTAQLGRILSRRVRATWFDPRYGIAYDLHTGDNKGYQTFVPPTSGWGNDWILVLDDVTSGFPMPGQTI